MDEAKLKLLAMAFKHCDLDCYCWTDDALRELAAVALRALCEHDWHPDTSGGLGTMVRAETCSKCGETYIPAPKFSGIDRGENKHWRNVEVG